jgi:ankyrin repeat protein
MTKRNIYLFISFALRKCANPNPKNYIGRTPLHLACEYNHNESIFILLFEIGDPLIKDIIIKLH